MANKFERTLVFGDIHGNYYEFIELLEKMKYNGEKDQLILLGDYIDRGYESYEVIQKIKELQGLYGKESVVALMGNHELMMITALEYDDSLDHHHWAMNGGTMTKVSYAKNKKSIYSDIEFIKALPTYYENENFYFVHAGINPKVAMDKQTINDKLWIREEFINKPNNLDKTIIFGHTVTPNLTGRYEPFIKDNKIGIDTALVYGGYLTGLEIINNEVKYYVQVKKHDANNEEGVN